MKKNVLSSKQTAILKFIKQFIESKPYPPSIRDIKNGCGLSSTSVVDYNLHAMEKAGILRRSREVSYKRPTAAPISGLTLPMKETNKEINVQINIT